MEAPNAKAERPEPIPYRFGTGQHTDRSDRNEFVELARCRHRAWRRAPAVEEACGRRERIAEAVASVARASEKAGRRIKPVSPGGCLCRPHPERREARPKHHCCFGVEAENGRGTAVEGKNL